VAEHDMLQVVIGAGSGIGAACAERIAEARPSGAGVVLADRDLAAVRAVAQRLELREATVVATELSDGASLARLAATVASQGSLGSVVLTAGVSPARSSGAEILDVDLVGVVRVLDAFEPLLVAGSVAVLTASIAGHFAEPNPAIDAVLDDPLAPDLMGRLAAVGVDASDGPTAYFYAKRGVMRLAQRRAVSWGAKGARVVSVSPTTVDTPMGQAELRSATGEAAAALCDMTPLGRLATPQQVADAMLFLASPRAAFITGCDLLVDGGVVAATRQT
jgi:NAD(P)-dependent dehydrogenase (short-subunit alcohol dehydrogenase family)